MRPNHASAIHGISIALLVLGILGVASCCLGLVVLVMSNAVAQSIAAFETLDNALNLELGGVLLTSIGVDDLVSLTGVSFLGGLFSSLFSMLVCAYLILVGYLGMKNYLHYNYYDTLFKLFLAAAIVTFLNSAVVTLVLSIIITVFTYRDRKAFQAGTLILPQQ